MAFEIFKMMGTLAINKEQALRDIQIIKQGVQKSTKEMGGAFTKFTTDHSAQFKKVGMVATAAGAVISLVIKKMGDSFDKYETALVDMGKITDESFESIENRMKELPPILGNLTELTQGYYQIVSAGVKDPVEAINTLTMAAQTAAAAHMNQSEVVKGLTKVMEGYQGQIEDVSEAADLMFAIEKEGQTAVGELIPIIGGLATISSQLKVSQDEMGGSLALISKTAGSTAEAATQYESVLVGLMKPTEMMTTALKEMGEKYNGVGFATAEAAIEELGFVEVLRLLNEATGGSSQKLGELFGRKEAIMGVTKLTANEMTTLSDTIDSVAEKADAADRAFQDWTTTGEAFNKEQAAVAENLLIAWGKVIDPMMDVIQRKLTDILTGMGEWVEKNQELAGSFGMLGGAAGMALIPFGLIMMMLPGWVIALPKIIGFIGVLSTKFAALAVSLGVSSGGLLLVLAGLTAVGLYIGKEWKKAWEEGQRIKEMEIESTKQVEAGLKKLKEAYNMTDEELQEFTETRRMSTEVLERAREKMEETADSVKKLGEVHREYYEIMSRGSQQIRDEVIPTFEELDGAILNSIINGRELSEQQEEYMAMRQRMSDVDSTATKRKIDELNTESAALLANMYVNLLTMQQIEEYRRVMLDSIIRDSSERIDHLRNMEQIEAKLFALSHTQTEIRLKDLERKRDAYIEAAKQAMLSADEEEEAIIKIQEAYEREKESILELAIARSENEIASLEKAIELREEAGEAIDELIKKRNAEIENLRSLKEEYGGTAAAAEKLAVAEGKRPDTGPIGAAKEGQYKVLNPQGGYEGVTDDPNALTAEEAAAGWTLVPLEVMKFQKGGLVKAFVDGIKHLAIGGGIGTDTVPIMATPGEYMIKKSMVDFIRRTGMVTGGLVEAIQKGLPTPNPEFAGGGMVSRPAGIQPGVSAPGGIWGGGITFGKESIVINAKTLDEATINEAGDRIMWIVHKKAKDAGLVWGRS